MRGHPLLVPVLGASLLFAGRAGAPPPVSSFPAEVRPASGVAPVNAWVWGFGRDAPPLTAVGVSVLSDGVVVDGTLEALGDAGVVFKPSAPFGEGAEVDVVVAGPASDVEASFVAAGPPDTTPPSLTSATLLDDGDPLVIGLEATDDRLLAGYLARVDGAVQSAAPPEFVLLAEADALGCIEVVAVDAAGNESEPRAVCRPAEPQPDVEPEPGVEPEPDPPPSCACSGASLAYLAPLALTGWPRRRLRRLGHRRSESGQ